MRVAKIFANRAAVPFKALVSDAEESPAQRGGIRERWSIGVHGGLTGRLPFLRAELVTGTLRVPGRKVVGAGQFTEKIADIRILRGICLKQCVIYIPALLTPGVEDYFLVSVISVQSRDHALHWIVEEDGADAGNVGEFEAGPRT